MDLYQLIKKSKVFSFIVLFIILEIILDIISSFSNSGGFTLTPYIRIVLLLFTLSFFILDIINIRFPLSFKKNISYQKLFVFGWLFFAVISVFIGLVNKNPILYVTTDFIYVAFGAILFFIVDSNKTKFILNYRRFYLFSMLLISIGYICLFFNIKAPAILLILIAIVIFINILKGKTINAIFLLIPYFILVVSTNRTQLIVFLLLFFILLLKKIRTVYTSRAVLFFGLTIMIVIFLLKEQILDVVLLFINPNSNIGYRINQIAIILNEGIDYSNPFFTSIVQRIIEAEIVIKYWTSDIFTFIFGLGSGGTIDGSKFFSDSSVLNSSLLGSKRVHNIHLLPFSLIFRYGLVGLIFFFILLRIVYQSFIKVLNEDDNIEKIFWNLFLISWVLFSMPAASYLWSMPVFWISLAYTNKQFKTLHN